MPEKEPVGGGARGRRRCSLPFSMADVGNQDGLGGDRSQMPVGAEALEAAGWPAGEWRCASGHRAPSCSLARTARKGRRGRRVFIPDQPGEIFYWSDELLTSSANVHAVAV